MVLCKKILKMPSFLMVSLAVFLCIVGCSDETATDGSTNTVGSASEEKAATTNRVFATDVERRMADPEYVKELRIAANKRNAASFDLQTAQADVTARIATLTVEYKKTKNLPPETKINIEQLEKDVFAQDTTLTELRKVEAAKKSVLEEIEAANTKLIRDKMNEPNAVHTAKYMEEQRVDAEKRRAATKARYNEYLQQRNAASDAASAAKQSATTNATSAVKK